MIDFHKVQFPELYLKYEKIRNVIMKTIPSLKFDGEWEIYGFENKIEKVDKKSLGKFIPKENKIIIHKRCFDFYNKGNKKELITTIIHELIHANGETNESRTEEKTQILYKMYKSEILSLL